MKIVKKLVQNLPIARLVIGLQLTASLVPALCVAACTHYWVANTIDSLPDDSQTIWKLRHFETKVVAGLALITSAGIGITFALSGWISRQLWRFHNDLMDQTHKPLLQRRATDTDRKDEIGYTARLFNEIIDSVRAAATDINIRVAGITSLINDITEKSTLAADEFGSAETANTKSKALLPTTLSLLDGIAVSFSDVGKTSSAAASILARAPIGKTTNELRALIADLKVIEASAPVAMSKVWNIRKDLELLSTTTISTVDGLRASSVHLSDLTDSAVQLDQLAYDLDIIKAKLL